MAENEVGQARAINPDEVCQQAVQAKMAVYQAKEHFETVLKGYNDQVNNLLGLVSLMKNRLITLEEQQKTQQTNGQ